MNHLALSHFRWVLGLLEGRHSLKTHWLVLHHQLDAPKPFSFSALSSHRVTELLAGTRTSSGFALTLGASMVGWTLGMDKAQEGKIRW